MTKYYVTAIHNNRSEGSKQGDGQVNNQAPILFLLQRASLGPNNLSTLMVEKSPWQNLIEFIFGELVELGECKDFRHVSREVEKVCDGCEEREGNRNPPVVAAVGRSKGGGGEDYCLKDEV
ncbi:hypothetical protein C2S52_008109 [Perilla frutescens var. hirtella]|nr:hypothetical protein C2S52_008109 [Perilla frutescens var. hirtella]